MNDIPDHYERVERADCLSEAVRAFERCYHDDLPFERLEEGGGMCNQLSIERPETRLAEAKGDRARKTRDYIASRFNDELARVADWREREVEVRCAPSVINDMDDILGYDPQEVIQPPELPFTWTQLSMGLGITTAGTAFLQQGVEAFPEPTVYLGAFGAALGGLLYPLAKGVDVQKQKEVVLKDLYSVSDFERDRLRSGEVGLPRQHHSYCESIQRGLFGKHTPYSSKQLASLK